MDTGLPQHIKEFLVECIESVGQLELLLKVYQAPGTRWTADSLSRELRSHPSSVSKQLHSLNHKGLLLKDGESKFFYDQENSLHTKVSELHELYQMKPVAIITYIYKSPDEKLKGFADAFKFKKD